MDALALCELDWFGNVVTASRLANRRNFASIALEDRDSPEICPEIVSPAVISMITLSVLWVRRKPCDLGECAGGALRKTMLLGDLCAYLVQALCLLDAPKAHVLAW